MFFINDRFGMRKVFAEFTNCNNLVIPGELQHGYWYSNRWEQKRNSQSFFLKTFLWGGIFGERMKLLRPNDFELIGDPFLYELQKPINFHTQENEEDFVLYPQYSSSLSTEGREAKHMDFLDWVCASGVSRGGVSFHPKEVTSDKLKEIYQTRGFQILESTQVGDQNFFELKRKELLSHTGVITNYLGPHVFRATHLGKLALIDNRIDLESFTPKYQQIIKPFLMNRDGGSSESSQLEIAQLELGIKNTKSKNHLQEIFFANKHTQLVLKMLQETKNVLAGIANLANSSEIATNPRLSPRWECPHCYTKNLPKSFSSDIFLCQKCYRRFRLFD